MRGAKPPVCPSPRARLVVASGTAPPPAYRERARAQLVNCLQGLPAAAALHPVKEPELSLLSALPPAVVLLGQRAAALFAQQRGLLPWLLPPLLVAESTGRVLLIMSNIYYV